MSFFKELGKVIGSAVPFAGPFINKESDKVFGVPTPREISGAEAGGMHKDFLNAAYPGTTSWEQLHATGNMGNTSAPETQARSAEKLQKRELQNRLEVADKSNLAHVISSSIGTSPMAVKYAMDAYKYGGMIDPKGGYDTQTQQGRDRMPYEISNIGANTKLTEAKLPETNLRGKISNDFSVVHDALRNFGGFLRSKYDAHVNNAENIRREYQLSNSKVPPRFKRYV